MLRVNSPGGSYVASDTIWREVVRARAAGKPVVVSMGDVAASGGYFISMAADAIVAQPGTITGSIGVLSGKPVLGEAARPGRASPPTRSPRARTRPCSHQPQPFSEEEWALVNDWLDHIYADFTGKVAAGRGMSAERVHELARGRVWTGADALANGLVDELGGLDTAAAHRPPPGRPARQRAAARLPAGQAARPAPPGRLQREPAAAPPRPALLAESWGPAWRLAARRACRRTDR